MTTTAADNRTIRKLEDEATALSAIFLTHNASSLGAKFRDLQPSLLDYDWRKKDPVAYAAHRAECEAVWDAHLAAAEEESTAFRRWTKIQKRPSSLLPWKPWRFKVRRVLFDSAPRIISSSIQPITT